MYFIVSSFFYLLSLLPWKIIYVLSDGVYFLVYYIIGYRKKVVMQNLQIAFPEKNNEERIRIAKDFYHQLFDTFLETIKMISISEKTLDKRFQCNYELVNDLYKTGQNVQLHGGHFFNWEFVNLGCSKHLQYLFLGVYAPLGNKVMDTIIQKMRSRFGTVLIPSSHFKTKFHQYANRAYALGLAADQNAGNPNNAYWLPFFGKMVPFVKGPEKGAIAKNTAVVFGTYYRVKRGYYKCEFSLFTTEPASLPEGAITIALRDFMEQQIRLRPSNYLWTHRRWKHTFDEEKYGHLAIENLPTDNGYFLTAL
ncbi:MAG: lysophospholipid acyltransferase family protein [Chitinophagaceae bacterium]